MHLLLVIVGVYYQELQHINLWLLDRYDRLGFDLSGNVSITVSKAKEYLADNQPGPAALVLDALTVVLLPADNERYTYMYDEFIIGECHIIVSVIFSRLCSHKFFESFGNIL